jgi:hypothetical protein
MACASWRAVVRGSQRAQAQDVSARGPTGRCRSDRARSCSSRAEVLRAAHLRVLPRADLTSPAACAFVVIGPCRALVPSREGTRDARTDQTPANRLGWKLEGPASGTRMWRQHKRGGAALGGSRRLEAGVRLVEHPPGGSRRPGVVRDAPVAESRADSRARRNARLPRGTATSETMREG